MNHVKLSDIAFFVEERIGSDTVSLEHYVTTDSLLQNKAGRELAQNLPPNRISLTKYKAGDVLVSNIRPYLKKIWQADCSGGCSSDVLVFRARPHHSPGFLYALLLQDAFFDYVMTGKKGSKMPRGDKQQIMLYPVLQFSGKDEERIGYLISAVSQKILINEKLNDNLEAMTQALYDYWFVQFDFPDENGKPYKSSGGKMVWNKKLKREIPVGWHAVRLSDACHVNVSTYREKEAWRMVKYIDTSNFTNNVIGKIETFDLKIDKLPSRARRKIQDADVLFSTVRPIQCHYGLMLNPEPNLLVSTGFVVLSAIRNIISPYLVFCIVSSQSVVQDMQQKAETGTSSYPSIRPEHLGDVIVPLPKERKEIMTYFEDIVEPLYRKIDMIHRNTRQLAEQRDFLLPLLMSGQVKVGEKENVASCQPAFIR